MASLETQETRIDLLGTMQVLHDHLTAQPVSHRLSADPDHGTRTAMDSHSLGSVLDGGHSAGAALADPSLGRGRRRHRGGLAHSPGDARGLLRTLPGLALAVFC